MSTRRGLWWRLVRFGFRLLYNELAWTYDLVSRVVSLNRWRAWQRAALPHLSASPGSRVLELAHGTANLQLDMRAQGLVPVGVDRSRAMGHIARRKLRAAGISAPLLARADARALPFAAAAFDAVTCRIAAHHFADVPRFVAEAVRVLRPGGRLAIADTVVSGEPRVARVVNTFEALRDPSHVWAYSLEDWETFLFAAGLAVTHREVLEKEIDFDAYAARMRVSGADYLRLRAVLLRGPEPLQGWLRPRERGTGVVFTLTEGVIVGQKPAA